MNVCKVASRIRLHTTGIYPATSSLFCRHVPASNYLYINIVSKNLAYWHFISSNKFFVLLMFEVIQTGVLHSYNGRIIYVSYNGRIIYDLCNGRIIFRTNLNRCLLGERELAVPCDGCN